MKETIIVIACVVVIAAAAFFCYTIQQEGIRKKELDKKMSDNLQKQAETLIQQSEINELIKQKLTSGELNIMGIDENGSHVFAKTNPKSDKKKIEKKKQ